MKIVTLGLGYIGLPTSIMFANHGQDVVGVDINQQAVNLLNEGQLHIEEPGLQEELEKALASGRFKASRKPEAADVFIVAVPTPNKDDQYKSCDLSYVTTAVKSILPFVKKGNTIIIESTIAPCSTEHHILPLIENIGLTVGKDVFLVHCPERVLPGQVIHELVYNNRIIGGVTAACTEAGKRVYQVFVKGELILTEAKTAEMSKLMENTYRDVNIALANELVKISADLHIDALSVIDMANKHPRVNLHQPGPGVGGHCLAVDPYFIAAESPEYSPLIQTSREINTSMPEFVVEKTLDLLREVGGKKVTVFGLTYKGDIDDVRESPAMDIYERLSVIPSLNVVAYDPHVERPDVLQDMDAALYQSDLVLVLADHREFKAITSEQLGLMKQKNVFDTKNILNLDNQAVNYVNLGNVHTISQEKTVGQISQIA